MLENPSGTDPPSSVKQQRYAPPNQRNRSLNRRKSGERFDRINNSFANDGDKSQVVAPRNVPNIDQGDSGSSNILNENARPGLIALDGCCSSEASQLLNDRWAAAMHGCNNQSLDLPERPVMYSGSGASAWGHFRLPHQMMDFSGELRRAMQRHANSET
ncbi:uncharacterized protein LOC100248340 [Vitis vinifera]|uniref:Uncharacterized protein n=1 Tax=Vitis vinifera TaxID=29760 RepID=D7T5A0_VITVI